MIYSNRDNKNSHLTAKKREELSLPAKVLIERKLISGSVLDFGCGYGTDIILLKKNGYDVIGYDPYYIPDYPKVKFDTIICNYVLNVLLPKEQSQVLMRISELLKSDGKAYYSVRRDIKRNGFLYNPKFRLRTYQCNVILPFKSIFRTKNCEIYEYEQYTRLNRGEEKVRHFLQGMTERKLLTESAIAYAIVDEISESLNHVLVIPKRKVANYFDLSQHEQTACWIVVNRVQKILNKSIRPDGYNIEIKIENAGGQIYNQTHILVTPKFNLNL